MEIRNGRIRVTEAEAVANSRWAELRHKLFSPTPPDGFLYLVTNPADQDPWVEFNQAGAVQVRPKLPEGFAAIYGERPIGDLGIIGLWDQQLGLWRDNRPPDWADAAQIAEVGILFEAHGMGRLLPYRLTNGAEFVCFPDAKLAGRTAQLPLYFELDARLAYNLTMHGIAEYQLAARALGNVIPLDQLVDFANPARRIRSAGH